MSIFKLLNDGLSVPFLDVKCNGPVYFSESVLFECLIEGLLRILVFLCFSFSSINIMNRYRGTADEVFKFSTARCVQYYQIVHKKDLLTTVAIYCVGCYGFHESVNEEIRDNCVKYYHSHSNRTHACGICGSLLESNLNPGNCHRPLGSVYVSFRNIQS